jgi:hypothetical protein
MQKPPRDRTDNELLELESFFSGYPVFADLRMQNCDRESILLAFRDIRLQTMKQGEAVFRCGEYGHQFFVILAGSVSVHVPTVIRFDTKETFYKELLEKYDQVIWKSIGGGAN